MLQGRTFGLFLKKDGGVLNIASSNVSAELKDASPPGCYNLTSAGISISKRKTSRKLNAPQLRTRRFGSSRLDQMEE